MLRDYLVEYRVALQPNKQPEIWKKICETIENKLEGDIRNLFIENEYSVKKIKEYIQKNKKDFPYLGVIKFATIGYMCWSNIQILNLLIERISL